MTFRPYVDTRVMVDALRAIELSSNSTIVCVDKGTLEIIRIFLSGYGKREVNFYTNLMEGGYELPNDSQWDILQDMIDQFLGDTDMASCDDFLQALQDIATSIQVSGGAGNCCNPGSSGINGAGSQQLPANEFEDDGTNFPEGFTDREEYLVHRCDYIAYTLGKIDQDLSNIHVVAVVGMTLSSVLVALGIAMITPIPFDELIVIGLAIVSALGTVGLFDSVISEARTVVQSVELLCAIFNTDTVDEAIQAAIDEIILQTSALSDPLRTLTRDVLNSFMTTDVFNNMFVDTGLSYPTANCSECTTGCEATKSIEIGTGPSNPTIAGEYTSAFVSGPNCHYLHVTSLGENSIRTVSITGWSSCNPPDQFRIASTGDGSLADLYSDDVFPTGQCFEASPGDSLAFIFSGNGPFTVTLECC